jgi:hypothetical protein
MKKEKKKTICNFKIYFYFQIGEQTVRRVVGGRVRVPAGPTVGAEIRRS